jgi:hypothetical protein
MARERTAAEARDRGIEVVDPHLQPRIGIGDPEAAGAVQVRLRRPTVSGVIASLLWPVSLGHPGVAGDA